MIETHHPKLSVRKQCKLLDVNRNRLDPRPPRKVEGDEANMKEIDRIYTDFPFIGSRKNLRELRDIGIRIERERCRRLIKAMGSSPSCQSHRREPGQAAQEITCLRQLH